jgi:uncharacterized phage infection (PIP) family protein YhgE
VANRITTIIDFVTTGAQNSVRGFRQSIADADGTVNKFKAGTSSAMTTLQANAGNLALAGGAALVAFGTKAVAAFQETALAAGKFSDATGLAVEDASRWNEVAGDVGVSTETIQGAFVRLNNAIGTGKLADLGIELQRTEDGAADVNATMLETIRVIGRIKDPTERAAAAQKAFGRGYAEAAEIILGSADDIERKLADVSEQKIIDEDELQRARDFRESMDNLSDSLQDVQLVAGEALVPLLGGLADLIVQAREAKTAIEDMIPGDTTLGDINRGDLGAFGLFVDAVGDVRDAFDDSSESGGTFRGVIQSMLPEINEAGNVVGELGDEVAELGPRWSAAQIPLEAASGAFAEMGVEARALSDDLDDTTDSVNKFEDGLNKAADTVDFLTSELNKLDDDLGELDALAAIEEQFKRIADTEDLEEQQTEIRRLIGLVGDYVGELENIPADKVTEIISVLRSGDVDAIRTLLDELTKDRFINVSIVPKQSAFESLNAVFQPGAAPTAPTFVNPNPSPVPVDMSTKIYNFPVGSTPTTVNQDLQTYYNRNGTR